MKVVPHDPAWWADPVMQRTPALFYETVSKRAPLLQAPTLRDVTFDPVSDATSALIARFRDARESAIGHLRRTA